MPSARPTERTREDSDRAPRRDHLVGVWLLVIAALVFVMVLIGGYTRLTNSGLSIVEWKPIHGVIPPRGDAEWAAEFAAYRQYPEYKLVNASITMDQFQDIYWVEWTHRQFGRFIGLAYALPLAWFWLRRRIPKGMHGKLLTVLALLATQGLIGWWMVKSGLVKDPTVSAYRLAAHLALACAILVLVLRFAFAQLGMVRVEAPARVRGLVHAATGLLALQILSGAFVAGTDAGFRWNTFPKMDGAWIPDGLYAAADGTGTSLLAAFDDPLTVQFQHRVLALLLALVILGAWIAGRPRVPRGPGRRALDLLPIALVAQVSLGIATLLHGVPVHLGVLHQAGALVLLTCCVLALYRLRSPVP